MSDPLALFGEWFSAAQTTEPEPTAMCLATVHPDGGPNARMVLLKSFDARGFVFFTHATSQKGTEMAANPHVALVFHWHTLHKSVRIRGVVSAIPSQESDAYWATRARSAQLSALATVQSEPMPERSVLEARVSLLETQHPAGTAIPRPLHWHGFVVAPLSIEFWTSAGVSRLHDRKLFVRRALDVHEWEQSLLQP